MTIVSTTADRNPLEEKEYAKAVYSHPAYLTYAEYIMRNAGLEETQAGIKIVGRNINNLRMQMTSPLWHNVKKD